MELRNLKRKERSLAALLDHDSFLTPPFGRHSHRRRLRYRRRHIAVSSSSFSISSLSSSSMSISSLSSSLLTLDVDIVVVVIDVDIVVCRRRSHLTVGCSPGRMLSNPSAELVSLEYPPLVFPTPPLGGMVLDSHLEVVCAVGVGLPTSSFPTPALSSPCPDVSLYPRGLRSPLGWGFPVGSLLAMVALGAGGGQWNGINEGMKKTNHDERRGSFS
jgi:hypothetical protein